MPIKITDTEMTSDETTHTAKVWPFKGPEAWSVTWLPGRVLTRSQAITAMTIAEIVADHAEDLSSPGDWQLEIDGLASELGLTGPLAIADAIKPRATFITAPEGRNRVGSRCPAWCIQDHDELLIPGKAVFGYMDVHKSESIVVSLQRLGNAEVRAVWHSDAPLVQLSAGYGVETIELSIKDARALTAILPLCLPYIGTGGLPVVDAILLVIEGITKAEAGMPDA